MMNIFIHLNTYHKNIEEVSMAKGFVDAGTHLSYVHVSESNRVRTVGGMWDWAGSFLKLKSVV
jgi:D-psicose/D-tagatose/L-ribulose 3-epimerase